MKRQALSVERHVLDADASAVGCWRVRIQSMERQEKRVVLQVLGLGGGEMGRGGGVLMSAGAGADIDAVGGGTALGWSR